MSSQGEIPLVYRSADLLFLHYDRFFQKALTFGKEHGIILKRSENAGVAQLVEQLICNQQVGGSSPSASSKR
jgi:hypothetical protein